MIKFIKSTLLAAVSLFAVSHAQVDNVAGISINFIEINDTGNADSGSGLGGVSYDYRISQYEISKQNIVDVGAANVTQETFNGASGDQAASGIDWYEAAAFVNRLNVAGGYQRAYDLTFSMGSWSMAAWNVIDQASTGVDSGTNPFVMQVPAISFPARTSGTKPLTTTPLDHPISSTQLEVIPSPPQCNSPSG